LTAHLIELQSFSSLFRVVKVANYKLKIPQEVIPLPGGFFVCDDLLLKNQPKK
jgi:hypothetical protein